MDSSLQITVLFCFLNVYVAVYGQSLTNEPSITNITVVEGTTAVLPCTVFNKSDHKVIWIGNSLRTLTLEKLKVADDPRYSVLNPTDLDWNLSIRNVSYSDEGQYQCRVNTEPVTSKTVNLIVLVPAKIITWSKEQSLREGETLVLRCNVTGIPLPSVSWYRMIEGNKENTHVTGEVFIIQNVTRYHAGIYQCVGNNDVSHVFSTDIKVSIEFAPKVTLLPPRIGQIIGKDTMLGCRVDVFPMAQVKWLTGNPAIDLAYFNMNKYTTELYRNNDTSVSLYLKIRNVQNEDFGNFTCLAQNYLGKDSDTMVVYEYVETTNTSSTILRQQRVPSTVAVLPPDVSSAKRYTVTSSVLISVILILVIITLF